MQHSAAIVAYLPLHGSLLILLQHGFGVNSAIESDNLMNGKELILFYGTFGTTNMPFRAKMIKIYKILHKEVY